MMNERSLTGNLCKALVAVLVASGGGCSAEATKCGPFATCGSAGNDPPPATCVPSETPDAVASSCGIFVSRSAGSDANDGSQTEPVKTPARAIELSGAEKKPVFVCAELFIDSVVIPAGIELYGGLECSKGWVYAGTTTKTIIQSPPGSVPLKLLGGPGTTRIEDVIARAPDAVSPGGSSIAAIVDGATAVFVRSELAAGNGASGSHGAIPDDTPAAGAPGMAGTDACVQPVSIDGGPGGQSECSIGPSEGGKGGQGGTANVNNNHGGDGQNGIPSDPLKGLGGTGDTGAGCEPGLPGRNGIAGEPGLGGTGMGIVSATGFLGADGRAGEPGAPGQGGGGGGGARAGTFCNGMAGSGASGGGGGGGGCGGKGGGGGKAGGSTIALISLKGKITFTETTLRTGNGGDGGQGAAGQSGGTAGALGSGGKASGVAPSTAGCNGGPGGEGGPGGSGGGGRGGHVIGFAYTGGTLEGGTFVLGQPGAGGNAGPASSASSNGAMGTSGEVIQF